MVKILDSRKSGFTRALSVLLTEQSEVSSDVREKVATILQDVRKKGDKALLEYTNRFDRTKYTAKNLRVSEKEIQAAVKACNKNVIVALKTAASRIEQYHKQQMPAGKSYKDKTGVQLGWRWTAIDSVGLYVPGGAAAYPSSVLMNAIPARVAGVKRMVMVVPTPDGKLNPVVLAAAHIAGVEEIYKVGGAQAVAALAYGTETLPKVDKIVGPGNMYVAEAKRQVFGLVGIDMIAGPSEILVISDAQTNPEWVAADLLSQAEHDTMARAILITDDAAYAKNVCTEVERTLKTLPRKAIAKKSWDERGLVIITKNLEEAAAISNIIAPEHLELAVANPTRLFNRVKHAGAVFLGRFTPEAIGDYIAGPSHVLPTSGSARFSSGLGVFDFIKRTSIIGCENASFQRLSASTETLAEYEGLTAHALSVKLRKKKR
ncbi:MAG: histidinol dehydrogenase [Proteobacteria bacterium]|nr:histidinol dehydrogenase [Pseudomonadota bacterium]